MAEMFARFTYITELLAAELIFLYSFPKRRLFALRYAGVFLFNEFLWFYFNSTDFPVKNSFLYFLLMLTKIVITIAGMCFCFKGSVWAIVSACVGGVALQHISYHIGILVSLIPFMPSWSEYLEFIVCIVCYICGYFVIGRSIKKNKYYENYDKRMIVLSVVIVLVCIGVFRFRRSAGSIVLSAEIGFSVYAVMCNVLALFIQFFLVQVCHAQKRLFRIAARQGRREKTVRNQQGEYGAA